MIGIARTRNQGLKLPTGGAGGPDLILDGHGFLNLSESVLRWKPFEPDQFGLFNLACNENAQWKNHRQTFGTLNVDDEIALTDVDVTLDNHGTLNVAEAGDVLRWKPFEPDAFGFFNLALVDRLDWKNHRQTIGIVNLLGDSDLKWKDTRQNLGTLNIAESSTLRWKDARFSVGAENLLARLGLVHLFQWGENTTNIGYNNPANATGRSNNTFADSSTDTSDDTLDVTAGATGAYFGTGLSLIPALTQVAWSYQTGAGSAGEEYIGSFRVNSGGTLREVFHLGDGALAVPAAEDYGMTAFGGQRMASDNTNVRTDLTALSAKEFIDGSLSRFTHGKAAVNTGDFSVDAVCYSLWLRESQRTPDSSGNSRHGILVGSTPPTLAAGLGTGSSLDFEGVDRNDASAGLTCGTSGVSCTTASGTMSVQAKIRRDRTGAIEEIAGKWTDQTGTGTNRNYLLYIDASDKLRFIVITGTPAAVEAVGTTSLTTGVTYTVRGEWTGSVLRVLVDGVQEGTTPAVTTIQTPDSTTPFTVGRATLGTSFAGSPFPFDGRIDDVELIIAGTTILTLPCDSLTGPTAPTIVTDYGTDDTVWSGSDLVTSDGRLTGTNLGATHSVRSSPDLSGDFLWLVRCSVTRPAVGSDTIQFRFLCPANDDTAPCFAVEVSMGTAAANDRLRLLRVTDAQAETEISSVTPTNGWVGQVSTQTVGVWLAIEVTNMGDANNDPRISVTWFDRPGTRNRLINNVALPRAGVVTNTSGFFGLKLLAAQTTDSWVDDLMWAY